ncbi:MAG: RluA family pseudouridine synthase [Gammaproteobacteria bacterium]
MSTPSRVSETRSTYYQDIDSELVGQRLDNFLLGQLKGVPRSHVYQLIRSGQVRVNSGRVRASYRLKIGDRVRVPPVSRRATARPRIPEGGLQWLEDRILAEDSRLLVLDKPPGMAVHAGTGIDFGCIEALRSLRPGLRALDLVHRLDRGTSGCLLVAKRRSALRRLHRLLRDGGVQKRYLTLLRGSWQHGRVNVDARLLTQRQRNGESFVSVNESGKSALSRFSVVENYGARATLMEVSIATGRTHQIRAHAAYMGHPVAGDDRYGDADFNAELGKLGLRRIFLHAHAVDFVWPDSEEEFMISSPLPEDLRAVQRRLESSGSRSRSRRI